MWTEARQRGHTLIDVVRWMSQRPAEIARLQRKGRIERGYHADFAVFAPDDAFVVDPAGCTTATPSPRTQSARWPASCAAPGCAAVGSTATSRAAR